MPGNLGCKQKKLRDTGFILTRKNIFFKHLKIPLYENGCLEWIAAKRNGYGVMSLDGKASGKSISTHRFSYIYYYGSIPNNLCVLHKCDNRACVRPDHLWLGTKGDNNKDTAKKGRIKTVIGKEFGNGSFTFKQIKKIREMLARGKTGKYIAKHFEVAEATISRIKNNISYKGV